MAQTKKIINWNQFLDKFPTDDWDRDFRYINDDEWENFLYGYELQSDPNGYYNYVDEDGNELTYDEYWELSESEQDNYMEHDSLEAYQYFVISGKIAEFILKRTDYPVLYESEVGYVLPIYWYGLSWSLIKIEVDNSDNLW